MSVGLKLPPIKVVNDFICDGHHRYVASLLGNFPLERIPGVATSATTVIDWKSVIFDEKDRDTADDIERFIKQDAEFNNIAIEAIVELLK